MLPVTVHHTDQCASPDLTVYIIKRSLNGSTFSSVFLMAEKNADIVDSVKNIQIIFPASIIHNNNPESICPQLIYDPDQPFIRFIRRYDHN